VIIPRYVGWQLGLRHAPESRTFGIEKSVDSVTVTKNLSGTQITALRRWALQLGLADGCSVAVLLRLDEDSARIIHGCDQISVPYNTDLKDGATRPAQT
jgi:hypothetical protein